MGFKDILGIIIYVTKSFSEVVIVTASWMSRFVQNNCKLYVKGKGYVWDCGVQKLFLWPSLRVIQRWYCFQVRWRLCTSFKLTPVSSASLIFTLLSGK